MGGMAFDERVRIGLVSVVPVTGDVVWDEFDGKLLLSRIAVLRANIQMDKSEPSSRHVLHISNPPSSCCQKKG